MSLNKGIMIGSILLGIMLLTSIAASILSPYDPMFIQMDQRLLPPSSSHLFGTDEYGRDLFSRVLYGGQTSFKIGFLTVLSVMLFGLFFGMIAGYFRRLDQLIMRVADGLMAFPVIILALAIIASLGQTELNIVIALTIVYIPGMTRVIRSSVIAIKEMEYIESAKAIGASHWRILWIYIFPNTLSPLIVQATLTFAYAILAEAGMSFLGLGTPPPAPSWGNILSDARSIMGVAQWMTLFPGFSIFLTVLGLNILGDGLRDKFDPKMKC